MKRILYIITVFIVFSCALCVLVGCKPNEEPVYGNYNVSVIDGLGNPMSQVIVKFVYPDGTTKTRITMEDGKASLNNVLLDNYKVIIEQGLSTAVITKSEFELTKDVTDLRLILRDSEKAIEIYGDGLSDGFAYPVGASDYDIPVAPGERFYFVFSALTSGTYRVSISDASMTVGYYGIPFYVQSGHCGDGEYDGKSFELVVHDTATPYVIGIDSEINGTASLKIERIADAPFDPSYAPWTTVPASGDLTKCQLSKDATLCDLDITDANLSVTLGDDGYYYTQDGDLVYLRINSLANAKYLDVSIAFMAGFVDKNFGQNFGGYVYGENGEFVGKYSYNDMIGSYYEACNAAGVYPLTPELAEAIKCHGNSAGWWNPNSANYLFGSVDEIAGNAWLFLCCTAE